MAAAGFPDLSALDVLVLHNVNHRGKAKTLADVCLVLNIEDTHLVTYAMKKLERLKLVKSGRAGKEKMRDHHRRRRAGLRALPGHPGSAAGAGP